VDDRAVLALAGTFGGALATWLSARAYSRRNERSDWFGYQERSLRAAVERADLAEARVREEERRHSLTRELLFKSEVKNAQYLAMIVSLREAVHRLERNLGLEETRFPDLPLGGD